jgi:hypothetical protein
VAVSDRTGVDNGADVGVNTNMAARLPLREKRVVDEGRFADIAIWQLTDPVPASGHCFKYRLAFVVEEVCVLRFDNEAGKGDHKHIGKKEMPYAFTTVEQLVTGFWDAIGAWSQR